MTVRREAPCPCGSGKKYKNCCQRLAQRERALAQAHQGAIQRVISWLDTRHPGALVDEIEHGFFRANDIELRDLTHELSPEVMEMVQVNAMDWLLAEGEIRVAHGGKARRVRVSDLVLGAGGPLLLAPQRDYMEEFFKSPLRIFEVLESRPGEGFLLRDVFASESEPLTVLERTASRELFQWDLFGARAVRVLDHWVLSGAIYGLGHDARAIVNDLREALAKLTESGADHASSQNFLGKGIVACWLKLLTLQRPPPVFMDKSGDPLMLVTDHYDVLDWNTLAHRLGAESDVEGDRTEGWTRFVELDDDRRRSLLAINIGKAKNRIEPFARTLQLADEGRVWLERVAGDSIQFVIRDLVDPVSLAGREGGPSRPAEDSKRVALSPEERSRHYQQFAESHYRRWADEKIPALGDRTPREAVATEEGRAALIDLLKHYETSESRRAKSDGCKPIDYGFLWVQAGLDRSRELTLR